MHTNPEKDMPRPDTTEDDVQGQRLAASPLLVTGLNLPGAPGPIVRGIGPDDPTEEVPKNQIKA
jgi:hypothetical protein